MPKRKFYETQAKTIIENMVPRKIKGYYCPDRESAKAKIMELIGDGSKLVTYGGSVTLDEIGIKEEVVKAGHNLLVRENYTTDEEKAQCFAKQVTADVYMMSTNAITLDGELVNIDGAGNRVACLIYGPKDVIVVAGMNKVVTNVQEGINRVKTAAAPPNTVRLSCKTPCAVTGRCGDCLGNTICCHTVITRASRIPGRIKVVLVGEELGY